MQLNSSGDIRNRGVHLSNSLSDLSVLKTPFTLPSTTTMAPHSYLHLTAHYSASLAHTYPLLSGRILSEGAQLLPLMVPEDTLSKSMMLHCYLPWVRNFKMVLHEFKDMDQAKQIVRATLLLTEYCNANLFFHELESLWANLVEKSTPENSAFVEVLEVLTVLILVMTEENSLISAQTCILAANLLAKVNPEIVIDCLVKKIGPFSGTSADPAKFFKMHKSLALTQRSFAQSYDALRLLSGLCFDHPLYSVKHLPTLLLFIFVIFGPLRKSEYPDAFETFLNLLSSLTIRSCSNKEINKESQLFINSLSQRHKTSDGKWISVPYLQKDILKAVQLLSSQRYWN